MNLNQVELIGRVTKDPELKSTSGGTPVVKFTLATNHKYTDKQGNKQESAQFHNIVAWGKSAEIINQYIVKGQEIYVRGRLDYRSWEKQDGTKGYMTEIIVDDFQMGAKPKGMSDQREDESAYTMPPRTAAEAVQEAALTQGHDDGIRLEDIPF